ncbi:EpsI family protein [Aeoliella sp. ICT_H6.2]|uniref:EpsI family protein n=1 Tax=Aeoliella straminimaris TaxID=2954799 RepID=A0A9X2FEM5_9BACT|nr:exosortase-associated EpsI family protein [Aeoliella straminimaris]MCO6047747.1 EpsI family protein [Aeoliella straminimaris]
MKSNTTIVVTLVAIAVLTIAPAILHGRYVSRWGDPAEQAVAAKALSEFPSQFGDWVAVAEGEPLKESVEHELGLRGYVNRVYQNRATSKEVSILLMVGEAGPLVRHPPEICYGSVANRILASKEVKVPSATGPENQFRLLDLASNSKLIPPFTVAYAWSSGGPWSVPAWPRVAFGGEPVLYKVQIQLVQSELDGGDPDEVLEEFASAFDRFVASASPSE